MTARRRSQKSKRAGHRPPAANSPEQPERLQKVLAAAGLGSRRECEELILAGRVEVDGRVVTELGTRADPIRQAIRFDGVMLRRRRRVYYLVNKPPGVICTNRDPSGRTRAIDLVPTRQERLFTVGRLDLHSEGLLLITNDGELANLLTHPRYGVAKTYRVLVAGNPTKEVLAKLRRGVHLAEGVARVANVRIKKEGKESSLLEMVLAEGRNREIRRALAHVGHKVLRLARIAIGPVRLGNLSVGEYRRLSRPEIDALRRAAKRGNAERGH